MEHDDGVDLNLVVTQDPAQTDCVLETCTGQSATGAHPETLALIVNSGTTLFAFVEGASPLDAGAFTLSATCGVATVELCDAVEDEDGDGLINCADPDCASDDVCTVAEQCANGIDDDGDGAIDCGQLDCYAAANCTP